MKSVKCINENGVNETGINETGAVANDNYAELVVKLMSEQLDRNNKGQIQASFGTGKCNAFWLINKVLSNQV